MRLLVKGFWLKAIFLALTLHLSGQDHLTPVRDPSSMHYWERDYQFAVADELFPHLDGYVQTFTFRANPSFGTEFGYRLLADSENNFQIEFDKATEKIWNGKDPDNPNLNASIQRKAFAINSTDYELLSSLFNAALSTIKPNSTIGLDGTRYYFSNLKYTGTTWSPKDGKMLELVDICLTIFDSIDEDKFSIEQAERNRIKELTEQLTNNE